MLTRPLITALLACLSVLALPAMADGPKIENRHFARSMERTEKFLKLGHKIPETALGHYEIAYSATMAMKIRMSLLGENDPRTGERNYRFRFLISQNTGPSARLQIKEEILFSSALLLRDATYNSQLTSPSYNELTDGTYKYARGKVQLQVKVNRSTGTNEGAKDNTFPVRSPGNPTWVHRIPKSLASVFAILCVKAPLGERMGVEFFTTDGVLNRAIFRRTSKKKMIVVAGEELPCTEIVSIIERGSRDDTTQQKYYIDPLGRVALMESQEGKIKASGKITKFTAVKAAKEQVVAGARKKLEADEWLAEAKEQLAKGKHHRAWRRMNKALKADPEHPGALEFQKMLQLRVTSDWKKLKGSPEKNAKALKELFKTQEALDEKHPDLKKMKELLDRQ